MKSDRKPNSNLMFNSCQFFFYFAHLTDCLGTCVIITKLNGVVVITFFDLLRSFIRRLKNCFSRYNTIFAQIEHVSTGDKLSERLPVNYREEK